VDEPTVRGRYLVDILAPRRSSGIPEEYDDADLGGTDSEGGMRHRASSSAWTSS